MPRPILDPATATSNRSSVFAELPQAARAFKHVPDLASLMPGDAVLVCNPPGKLKRLIQRFQLRGGMAAEHAVWTHVAMYVGDGVTLIRYGRFLGWRQALSSAFSVPPGA